MFEVGKNYRTVGGWEARVIWCKFCPTNNERQLIVIHQPYTKNEMLLVHNEAGECYDVPYAWLTEIEIV